MKSNLLPKGADALLAVAEDVAAVLSERRNEFGMGIDAEASLRAGIAAATFGVNAYLEFLVAADQSPAAMGFLPEAKARCDRSIKQLRRRVVRSIAELRRHMSGTELRRIAESVRSVAT